MMWFQGLPIPPSANEHLMPVYAGVKTSKKTGKRYHAARMKKTGVHDDFLLQCLAWRGRNPMFWRAQKALLDEKRIAESRGEVFALRVDCYFVFHVEQVFSSKQGLVMKIDDDNRVKPMRDALAKMLEIDDKHIFAGYSEKVTTRSKELACTIVRLSRMTPRTLEEIQALMPQPGTKTTPGS